jgi:hypothetical protein
MNRRTLARIYFIVKVLCPYFLHNKKGWYLMTPTLCFCKDLFKITFLEAALRLLNEGKQWPVRDGVFGAQMPY